MKIDLYERLKWAQYYLAKARMAEFDTDKKNYSLIAESQILKGGINGN